MQVLNPRLQRSSADIRSAKKTLIAKLAGSRGCA
jgi:hypothetical protein